MQDSRSVRCLNFSSILELPKAAQHIPHRAVPTWQQCATAAAAGRKIDALSNCGEIDVGYYWLVPVYTWSPCQNIGTTKNIVHNETRCWALPLLNNAILKVIENGGCVKAGGGQRVMSMICILRLQPVQYTCSAQE